MQLLSTEILDWVNPKDVNLDNYFNNNLKGCFLEVVLQYSDKLHNLHNEYALVDEKLKMTKEMLSEYQLQYHEIQSFFFVKTKNLFLIQAIKENTISLLKI